MPQLQTHESGRLLEMLYGYRQTCIIVTAVQAGVIDELSDQALGDEELARRLGAHLPSLRRFLRALYALEIVQYRDRAAWLTTMGRQLVRGASDLRDRAMLTGEEYLPAWTNLGRSLLTGETAFDHAVGMNAWQHRAQHPHLNESFNRVMTLDQIQSRCAVVDAYDFSNCRLVIDVGGGHGRLIAEILSRYPQLSGIVFDQPSVVEGALSVLSTVGALPRCRMISGSFFESVPTGGDIYLLQHILHDWNDEQCLTILRNCRAAMDRSSTLLVIENLVPEGRDVPTPLVMLDLHMMVMLGGQERTRREYDALLQTAGLSSTNCIPAAGSTSVIVAKPLPPLVSASAC